MSEQKKVGSLKKGFEVDFALETKLDEIVKALFLINKKFSKYEYRSGTICEECGVVPRQLSLINIVIHKDDCISGLLFNLKNKSVKC